MSCAPFVTCVRYRKESSKKGFRIRVGYVSANIKSKTTVYMAQDIWRFHNRSQFEVHVYATTPPDHADFLSVSMRGVDWRKKVRWEGGGNMRCVRVGGLLSSFPCTLILSVGLPGGLT